MMTKDRSRYQFVLNLCIVPPKIMFNMSYGYFIRYYSVSVILLYSLIIRRTFLLDEKFISYFIKLYPMNI